MRMERAKPQRRFRRYECKYVIDERRAEAVRAAVRPYVAPDRYAEGHSDLSYDIQSLYLDSPDLRLFWESEEGLLARLKLRVRGYPDAALPAPMFLEIKRRYDRLVLKDRAAVDPLAAHQLLDGGVVDVASFSTDEQACHDEFVGWMARWRAGPMVWVRYRREAYAGNFHPSLRVTFDRDLRCAAAESLSAPEANAWVPIRPGAVILELKFDRHYPDWLRRLVQRFELRQQSFSKYGHAIKCGLPNCRVPASGALGFPRG